MLTSLDQLQANFALVGDKSQYAGSMNQEYLSAVSTTQGATGLAANALSGLNITMGQALLPTVVAVSGKVTEAANVMRHWAQEHPAMTKAIMLFLGVGAGLLVLLGGLALAFGALTAAAAPLGIALGPLLLIVAGIAALAAAAYLVYDNWGPISAWFGGIWQGIRDMASGALAFLVNAFLTFTPLGLLVQAFAPALAYLQSLNFTEIGRNLIQGLINGITSMLGAVAATITGVGSSLVTLLKAKLGIHSPSRVFAGLGGFVMAGLDQGLADNTAGPLQRIASLSDAMTAGFRADGGAMLGRIGDASGQIASAVALGAAVPAAALPAPAPGPGAPTASVAPASYTITINAGTAPAPDIAREVRKAIEDIERERRGRGLAMDKEAPRCT
jgi:phage-related minor tail protein